MAAVFVCLFEDQDKSRIQFGAVFLKKFSQETFYRKFKNMDSFGGDKGRKITDRGNASIVFFFIETIDSGV